MSNPNEPVVLKPSDPNFQAKLHEMQRIHIMTTITRLVSPAVVEYSHETMEHTDPEPLAEMAKNPEQLYRDFILYEACRLGLDTWLVEQVYGDREDT